jgi:hypothetical protein
VIAAEAPVAKLLAQRFLAGDDVQSLVSL